MEASQLVINKRFDPSISNLDISIKSG